MTIDGDAAYQVLLAHDARFDGRLFVGVTSTGVYCRPICRVRMPSRRNCRFFATPAQAEAAAFRPCLKCRPEIAPGPGLPWTVMDASRTLALPAASALADVAARGEAPSVADVAARLGVSDRHLRRIFFAEHGVTPLQYLQTRRLLLAKQLLTDTQLPISQIALTSGFRSLRRFNAAFLGGYRMNPTRLRKTAPRGDDGEAAPPARRGRAPKLALGEAITVQLAYRAPLDVDALLAFIAARAIPGVEVVVGRAIRRTVAAGALAASAGWLEARFADDTARVQLAFSPSLDAAPATIAETLADLPGAPGIRVPGSVDAFELAVRAVLGQQVTVAAARTLAKRVVERFGAAIATPWAEVDHTFPRPADLATVPIERIAELGIIRSRAAAIQSLASQWSAIEPLVAPGASPETLVARLCEVPGIGPWTTHYIAMRGLGWPDAFPPGDVAAAKAMRTLFNTTTARDVAAHAERWRPWRGYALLRLWNSLGASP